MIESDDIDELRALEAADADVPELVLPVSRGPEMMSKALLVAGFIPVRGLIGRFRVPYYDPRTKEGYQRSPKKARINQFAVKLRTGHVDLPNSILFNVRNPDAPKFLKNGHLRLPDIPDRGQLENLLHVVDGQHRVLALRKAVFDGWDEGADYQVPFLCMLGANEHEEMKQFYEINSNAKSVRTDLALAIIKQWADNDPAIMEELEGKGTAWKVAAQTLVERMATESFVWRNRIRLPLMEKGISTMPSASMVKSLQPVLESAFFRRLNDEQRIRVLDAYWGAIKAIIPEAFSEAEAYTIQKGVGVRVLHNILPIVVEVLKEQGVTLTDSSG
ncbi:MAG: DGQHR domain-containing protein, partial [Limisphaerales bacterium]